MIHPPGILPSPGSVHEENFPRFKTGVGRRRRLVALFSIDGSPKLQALPPTPTAKRIAGLRRRRRAGEDRSGADQGDRAAEGREVVAARRQHQRCEPLDKTEIYGVVDVRSVDDIAKSCLRARQQAFDHDRRRGPAWAGRRSARAASCSTCRLRRDRAERDARSVTCSGATWHDIQNCCIPLRFAPCKINQHLQRRRLDLGQRPRYRPSGGALAKSIKSMKVMLARIAADGVGDREQRTCSISWSAATACSASSSRPNSIYLTISSTRPSAA